jgi:hypothetical protein
MSCGWQRWRVLTQHDANSCAGCASSKAAVACSAVLAQATVKQTALRGRRARAPAEQAAPARHAGGARAGRQRVHARARHADLGAPGIGQRAAARPLALRHAPGRWCAAPARAGRGAPHVFDPLCIIGSALLMTGVGLDVVRIYRKPTVPGARRASCIWRSRPVPAAGGPRAPGTRAETLQAAASAAQTRCHRPARRPQGALRTSRRWCARRRCSCWASCWPATRSARGCRRPSSRPRSRSSKRVWRCARCCRQGVRVCQVTSLARGCRRRSSQPRSRSSKRAWRRARCCRQGVGCGRVFHAGASP